MEYINIILLVCFCVLCYIFLKQKRKKNFPKGPGLPIIGSLFELLSGFQTIHLKFSEHAKKYGNVFYFRAGGMFDAIILNDIDAVEEAFVKNKNDFSGRNSSWVVDAFSMNQKDIVFADYGPDFKNRKNIAAKGLSLFLSGRNLEMKVSNAITISMKYLDDHASSGKAFDPFDDISLIVQNVICGMVFSKTFTMDDEEFQRISKNNKDLNACFETPVLEEMLPRYIVNQLSKVYVSSTAKRILRIMDDVFKFNETQIKLHKEHFDLDRPAEDIVDYLLLLQETDSENKKLDDVELLQIADDLFFAGTDSTINTLAWIVLFLAVQQDEQQKAYEEIKKMIGNNGEVKMSDQHDMPYCKAVQMECMRLGMASPIGLPHSAICDSKLYGYDIPKGTLVWVNHYALHQDSREWKNPEEFNPNRFLEEDGTLAAKPRSWLPFSAGRRACLGENVAKAEIFMVWVSIIQKFKIVLPEGEIPQTKQDRIAPPSPRSYKIIIEKRQ